MATPASDQRQSTLLVVEDDVGLAELICRALTREGHLATAVHNAGAAIERLEREPVDLMLMDYGLPDLRGDALIVQLEQADLRTPFIVVTGHGSETVAVEMMKRGARDYLIKDNAFLRLVPSVVERVLRQLHQEQRLRDAESALVASQERYHALAQVSPVGIGHFDAEGNCIDVNDRWSEITGIDRHQACSGGWSLAIHSEDRARVLASWNAAVAQGMPFHSEHRVVRPDGVVLWVVVEAVPERDAQGRVQGFVRILFDITKRKEMEAQLVRREQEYRSLTENVPDIISRIDRNLRYVFVNRQATALTGYSASSFIGKTNRELGFPLQFTQAWENCLSEVLETGAPTSLESSFPSPQGLAHLETLVVPEHGPDGTVETVLSISRDITQRKLAEEALRRSEERFRLAAEHMPGRFVVYNAERKIVFANANAAKELGYSLADMVGRRDAELFPPSYTAKYLPRLEQVFATGKPDEFECTFDQDEGESTTLIFNCAPLLDERGRVRQVLVITHDITALKEAEGKARQHLAELAHVTRLSTMGEMVSGLAHEINQPLYAIGNFAEASLNVAKRQPEAAGLEITRWLQQISEQSKRCGEIIRRLGRFAKKTAPRRMVVDLHTMLQSVVNLLEFELRAESVDINITVPPESVYANCDQIQIEQVLVNLVRNAIEAMAEISRDQRSITLSATIVDDQVVVAVSDTGPKIEQATLDRIFEPFYSTKPQGMGMGMPISQSIIRDHGGDLVAKRNPTGGVTLSFTLPQTSAEERQDGL